MELSEDVFNVADPLSLNDFLIDLWIGEIPFWWLAHGVSAQCDFRPVFHVADVWFDQQSDEALLDQWI